MNEQDALERAKNRSRSVSQYNTYLQCPRQYWAKYVAKEKQRPAAWLPQGTAVHAAAEEVERSGRCMPLSDAQDVFREVYSREVNRYLAESPYEYQWFGSGPKYPPDKDIERRYDIGLEQVEKYLTYYTEQAPDEVIWIAPDGTPGIELHFRIQLADVQVTGYIDAIVSHPKRGTIVRDNKTGKKPGDDFQLATYAVAVEDTYGEPVNVGDYWMAQRGGPTLAYKLDGWTKDVLTEHYAWLDRNIKEENFEPDPEPKKCNFCSVKDSCPFSLA